MNVAVKPGEGIPSAFLNDVVNGLSQPQKAIPPSWLYDRAGSELFELITRLPEYYVTRTEVDLLRERGGGLVAGIGHHATVVEYGAGAATKIRLLLDSLDRPAAYVAIDISYEHLRRSLGALAADYPALDVRPVEGDFLAGAVDIGPVSDGPRVGFFPGSTIGNLSDEQIVGFLSHTGATLGEGAWFVLGADLRKSPDVLIPAYDDAAGVTARFNKNLITRINRELSGTMDSDQFAHRAIWSDEFSRIEMHLESLVDQTFSVAGQSYSMAQGETIHTENSRKFRPVELERLAQQSGWRVSRSVSDSRNYFALLLLERR